MRRTGFTLIELLVVVLIIGILAGLSYLALGRTGATARVSSTRSTLQQIDSLLSERIEAFRRHDFRNQATLMMIQYNAAPSNGLTLTRQAAERMIRKDRFRAAFPSRFEDLFGLDGVDGDIEGSNSNFARDWAWGPLPGTPHVEDEDFDYFGLGDDAPLALVIRQLRDSGQFNPEFHDPETESAELLYLVFTRGTAFGVPHGSIDNIDADHMLDTDGDGLTEFVDDWEQPIRFYNWPTGLMRIGAAGDVFDRTAADILLDDAPPGTAADVDWTDTVYTHALEQDPDDPYGVLSPYFDVLAPGYMVDRGSGEILMAGFNDPDYERNFHTPDTWHLPLLVSAGPNGELGLGEPNAADQSRLASPDADGDGVIDANTIQALGDNVTNRQQAGSQ